MGLCCNGDCSVNVGVALFKLYRREEVCMGIGDVVLLSEYECKSSEEGLE